MGSKTNRKTKVIKNVEVKVVEVKEVQEEDPIEGESICNQVMMADEIQNHSLPPSSIRQIESDTRKQTRNKKQLLSLLNTSSEPKNPNQSFKND